MVYSFLSEKKCLGIKSRRYLGSKTRVLPLIDEVINKECSVFDSFCDIFAGTGVVGNHFNTKNIQIISNDILFSNYASLNCWLKTNGNTNMKKVIKLMKHLNSLKSRKANYVSKNFGGTYFTMNNAIKIGIIREEIEKLDITKQEKFVLLTSLLYAIDKVANTCGHYDAFRANLDTTKEIKLKMPKIDFKNNRKNKIYNKDANELIKEIHSDILYIDPPYNSRQYSDSYHLLENIIEWNKPEVFGKAKKMKRDHIKSKYNTKNSATVFRNLIKDANCKYILVSYNNTGEKGNDRSNAKISDKELVNILKKKGHVKIYEQSTNNFSAGKSAFKNHKERIFFVG